MSMLASAGISQCLNFYSIKNNEIPSAVGSDKDFFVGEDMTVNLTIPNGQTVHVRDLVVLGKLIVKSSNLEDTSVKGAIVAHDIFIPGILNVNNVNVKSRHVYTSKNRQQFRKELQDLIIDWFIFQRRSAEKMGLKSVLI